MSLGPWPFQNTSINLLAKAIHCGFFNKFNLYIISSQRYSFCCAIYNKKDIHSFLRKTRKTKQQKIRAFPPYDIHDLYRGGDGIGNVWIPSVP